MVVAVVLLWAAVVKFRADPRRSALKRLVGADRVTTAFRVVGVLEILLAASLLVTPWPAAVWFVALTGYLVWARKAAPDESCGCLSEKHTPATIRSIARATLLVALTLLASTQVPVLAAEAVAVVLLSPELDGWWLMPLRRLKVRLLHPLAGRGFEVPVASTVQQLHKSQAYRSVYPLLRSDLLDTWDEGEWRILTYSADQDGERATAVFAVPRTRYEPDQVRVALA
ncbi:hypothetical protein EV192_106202 [Actinocrispum wychmicini]|uniref:Methylamine utilisation protein MauE domain-containing protein n=2 Tax=Actinocrispum wychmicini TaxID=1213861 RepID=A0A4R2JIC1_9PSEU|nr:hypothetical protein EV192_106202 [Actinocrispum wychmicini]